MKTGKNTTEEKNTETQFFSHKLAN